MKLSTKAKTLLGVSIGVFLFMQFAQASQADVISPQLLASKMRADRLLKEGRLGPSIFLYEKILAQEPSMANAYYNLATAYYLLGNTEKTLENLEIFVGLRPQDAEALYNLGCLKLRAGALTKAQHYLLQAQACSPALPLEQKIKEAREIVASLLALTA